MSDREKLLALLAKDAGKKSDALIVLAGDRYKRADHGAQLFKEGRAPRMILSGGLPETSFAIPASKLLTRVIELGVPKDAILAEERSQNTREQAVAVLKIARERGWKSIAIIASPEHQPRAFLTFLQAAQEFGYDIALQNAPVPSEIDSDFLRSELAKIEEYQKKGDVASYEEGVRYLESQ